MVQAGGEWYFLKETVTAQTAARLGTQDLHGHAAAVLQVFGQVHRSHPARAEFPVHAVVVRQSRLQPVYGVCHQGAKVSLGIFNGTLDASGLARSVGAEEVSH